jgi:CRISPR-associated protein Cmr2
MDGDQMGKWLSGTHEDLPKFAEILHPQVREQLKGQSNWQTVLETQRLMSPSLHAAISEALANFALKAVPFVVEELHAGRLVYAGGDDVLALLPLADVLPAAHKLRALFSGEAKRFGNDILVEFMSKQWTGWLEWEGTKTPHDGQKRNCQHWHRRCPSPSPAQGCASSRAGSGRGRQRTL